MYRPELTQGRCYVYGWNRMGRKGELCQLLIVGRKNSVLVEFADGHRAVTSANALKPVPVGYRRPEPRLDFGSPELQ